MKRSLVIAAVERLCAGAAGFREDAQTLTQQIGSPVGTALVDFLLECGAIPERFGHDSSQEKLYAKYCDILLALAFQALGLSSTVLELRAESADVVATSPSYSIVGDAKAFRLSRTAKNQKDFKITALAGWRGSHDFACLICPLYHYPTTSSQIYEQAVASNVTLLGYVHLALLVVSRRSAADLRPLWNVGTTLQRSKDAKTYWKAIDAQVCAVAKRKPDALAQMKAREAKALNAIKREEITYLQSVGEKLARLSHKEAIRRLRKAIKLDEKIAQINSVAYWKSDN